MAHWVTAVPADRYEAERLYQQDTLELSADLAAGDDVVLVGPGDGTPVVFGLGRVTPAGVTYVLRRIDTPMPAAEAGCSAYADRAADEPVRLSDAEFAAIRARLGDTDAPARRREWMVSLDLPIEADSPAEAVRIFWSYVRDLGPQELPAFVWPRGDELAMRPFVLGTEHEMDPEEE